MIISQNKAVKDALIYRWKQLGLYTDDGQRSSYKEIIVDAQERAPEMKITGDRLSKYLSNYKWGGKSAGLSESQIIWLLIRWKIPFAFTLGDMKVKCPEGIIEYVLPEYNLQSALLDLENRKAQYAPKKKLTSKNKKP